MGIGSGEIFAPPAGRRSLNPNCYRIRPEDRLGEGSLRQKCADNLTALELLRRLETEGRAASEDERRVLVKYVGWGGLPQVFAEDSGKQWRRPAERLRELLTPEEYASARASTLNAHYTAQTVIEGIYESVQRLGFTGGRILEPALGLGHFFGLMPEEMRAQSTLTGIELDGVTLRLARHLYPDADLRHQGFEKAALIDESFDLAISNVPFGDYQVGDPQFAAQHFLIHDYFFAKAIEKVRPGGLLVFITSKGTLDKADPTLREHLANRADFLGAVRLPNTAFKQNANTEVTTDIVFLRRPEAGQVPGGREWLNLAEHHNSDGEAFQINQYFAGNPQMMLGVMRSGGRMYRGQEATLAADERELGAALREAVAQLPPGIFRARERVVENRSQTGEEVPAPDHLKENAYTLHIDGIAIREGRSLTILAGIGEDRARRIRGLIRVRDAVREALKTQADGAGDEAIVSARRLLNAQYDNYVSRFGPINERANLRAFTGDPDLPLLLSLEDYNDETKTAVKMAIFRERTIQVAQPVRSAETPKDALVLALNEKGRVDLEHIEMLLGRVSAEFLPELKGLIYRNPKTDRWETEDQYLSGNVRVKLAEARIATEADPTFVGNVSALEAVQPDELTPTEIEARLGAVWIPADDVKAFIIDLLDTSDVSVAHAHQIGTWLVKGEYSARSAVANTTDWGTARYSALELIQDALNLKTPTVYDLDPKSDRAVVNPQETEASRDRLEKIKERFKSWIWEDDGRRERLCRKYNTEFNSVRLRVFNGSHLTLPRSSPQIILRPHQKNAVWRIVQSDDALLAHVVGAGKTYTMVAAALELKRLGLAHKPMFVVPNHMLGQFSSELLTLYPTANILVAGKDDFEASRRARLFSRIATGNWDAVIVTHASFEKIPVSLENRKAFIGEQIAEVEMAIREQQGSGTRMVKELEKMRKRLELKLESMSGEDRKDQTLTFEELGVDRLFVDEAHKFKNLFYVTKMTRVAGLPQTASERAFDMFLKVQHIQKRNGGGGVVFATGTPISNTMAEMFTMQRYLQMASLRAGHLAHFDSWAATFGETVTTMELSPNGSGYRLQSRFARFVNVPELMQQFRQVADVQTAEMLKLPVPKLTEGRPVTISAPVTPELKAFVQALVERTEKIKNGSVKPWEDNMLKVTSEGRKAALDIRLVLPHVREAEDSKVNRAVEKIQRVWVDSTPKRGAQLVFCDLSTPAGKEHVFSVYDDVRSKLLARGIPEADIAFVQDYDNDAAKSALFKSVREGKVRILLGSTPKMGEGTNVQKRLVALHHLDAPWRPADIEQRDGRILRQGNENEFVSIYRYVTEGSFDAYMWQTLENKSRFIAQVMTGDAAMRKAEDVDAAALTYAEVKAIASGNPLVIEKAAVDAEVMRLTRLRKQHLESQYQIRHRVKSMGDSIGLTERQIANLREDLRTRADTEGESFTIRVMKENFIDRTKAGRALVFLGAALKPFQTTKVIGEIAGFPISLQRSDEKVSVLIHGKNTYQSNVSDNALGTISSLEHALRSFETRLRERELDLQQSTKQREELTRHQSQPFEYEDKLTAAAKRQQEIVTSLDLTKNQASAAVGESPAEEAAIAEAPAVSSRVSAKTGRAAVVSV